MTQTDQSNESICMIFDNDVLNQKLYTFSDDCFSARLKGTFKIYCRMLNLKLEYASKCVPSKIRAEDGRELVFRCKHS